MEVALRGMNNSKQQDLLSNGPQQRGSRAEIIYTASAEIWTGCVPPQAERA